MTVQIRRRRFSVKEYYHMAKAGILKEDDRLELIEGEIVEMAPIGSRHAACVIRLIHFLSQQVGSRAVVSAQNPVHLGEHSEPQPDITLLRPRDDFYATGHPGSQDILLLIEVADTSIEYDREVKVPLYARTGIGEVWLVDLESESIEVYQSPTLEGYRRTRVLRQEERLAPEVLPGLELSARAILGL